MCQGWGHTAQPTYTGLQCSHHGATVSANGGLIKAAISWVTIPMFNAPVSLTMGCPRAHQCRVAVSHLSKRRQHAWPWISTQAQPPESLGTGRRPLSQSALMCQLEELRCYGRKLVLCPSASLMPRRGVCKEKVRVHIMPLAALY
jgi:hypothetical protein